MKLFPVSLFCAAVLALAPARSFAGTDTDAETTARISALDVAGAFSNDGFKIRDGHWSGTLKPKDKAILMTVNLYAGNQYFFAMGTQTDAKVALAVYDESGKKVSTETWMDGNKFATSVAPATSGPYYVSLRLPEGDPASFCLLYCYK
jgi:hypothetical protein